MLHLPDSILSSKAASLIELIDILVDILETYEKQRTNILTL